MQKILFFFPRWFFSYRQPPNRFGLGGLSSALNRSGVLHAQPRLVAERRHLDFLSARQSGGDPCSGAFRVYQKKQNTDCLYNKNMNILYMDTCVFVCVMCVLFVWYSCDIHSDLAEESKCFLALPIDGEVLHFSHWRVAIASISHPF